MNQNSAERARQRRRDVRAMVLGCLAVLAGLCVGRFLDVGVGIAAGLAILTFGYLYRLNVDARSQNQGSAEPSAAFEERPQALTDAQSALVSALSQPAFIVKNGQVQIFNTAAGQLFNLPEGSALSVESLRHPVLLEQMAKVQADGLGNPSAGRQTYACEIIPARFPDQHWLARLTALDGVKPDQNSSVSSQPVPDILVVFSDQAPVRQAERARADFLANASHELRTPLTSISGFVETMQGPAKDDLEAWPRFIDIISEQATHMNGLISDLLSLSRIELVEHETPTEMIELQQILPEALEAMSHIGKGRNLKIELDLPASSPEGLAIVGFESEVKQVVQNLVSNAMKYSPVGGAVIVQAGRASSRAEAQKQARSWKGANRVTLMSSAVAPAAVEGTDGAVWLRVRDRGPGIEAEYLPRLGERFFRVDASRGGPVEGTGLGLAIVKHIMAHHQGGLAVESIDGEGTQFTVWFKAA